MNNRISGLDAVRYIALLCVIATHFFDVLQNLGYAVHRPALLNRMAELVIAYFFVSSAFLITTLFLEEYDRKGSFSLRKFFYRRGLRLLPAYFILILLVYFLVFQLPYFFLNEQPGVYFFKVHPSILNFLFLVPHINEFFYPSAPYLFHTGTLGVEFQFYIIAGLLFYFFRKWYFKAWMGLLVLIGLFIYIHNMHGQLLRNNGLGLLNTLGVYLVYAQLHLFAAGVGAAFIYYRLKNKPVSPFARVASLLLFAGTWLSYLLWAGGDWNDLWTGAVNFTLLLFFMYHQPALAAFPYAKATQFLGNISYGAYLFHYIVMVVVVKTMSAMFNLSVTANMLLTLLLVFVACTLAGIASYYLIERPFLRIKKKYTVLK